MSDKKLKEKYNALFIAASNLNEWVKGNGLGIISPEGWLFKRVYSAEIKSKFVSKIEAVQREVNKLRNESN